MSDGTWRQETGDRTCEDVQAQSAELLCRLQQISWPWRQRAPVVVPCWQAAAAGGGGGRHRCHRRWWSVSLWSETVTVTMTGQWQHVIDQEPVAATTSQGLASARPATRQQVLIYYTRPV